MDNPDQAFEELLRVTKPGGSILIFVYPKSFDIRKNLNTFIREFSTNSQQKIINGLSDELDSWREIDGFFAETLANYVGLSFKYSREWQKFQWFDGVTPRYHWSLESRVVELAASAGCVINSFRAGCYHIKK
jgi:SAM-dependent methyltransferase